jgi:hypothetical protein
MKFKTIKATFKGSNGSCNYITNEEYTLLISYVTRGYIKIENVEGGGYCDYNSIISFLNNWDNIKNI